MPIACDPTAMIDVWLKCDADTPRPERPVFVFRPPTGRVAMRWRAMLAGTTDDATIYDRLYGELRAMLTGWRNMPDPDDPGRRLAFERGALEDVTTTAEAWELMARLSQGVEPADEKKSESPSPTPSGASARGDAPAAANGAPTPPAS